jgi:hypothetical protein
MSSGRDILSTNGFGRGNLTILEVRALYDTRYPVPPAEQRRLEDGGERGWHTSSAHAEDGVVARGDLAALA